jgi:multidrug efflux pump subunit AcrB
MNVCAPFIRRPVGTSLLAIGLFMAGVIAYHFMPVAAIPRVDFPMISVSASLPGADPATVASSLAAPLERRLAQIAGVTEITSVSTLGGCSVTIQFDLNRNVGRRATCRRPSTPPPAICPSTCQIRPPIVRSTQPMPPS